MTALVFKGYDAEKGLLLGQRTATERILDTAPGFVRSVEALWDSFSHTQRRTLVGYTPAVLSVLLAECAALKVCNSRYDLAAQRSLATRAQRESAARDAMRKGRDLRDQVGATLRTLHGASALSDDGVSRAFSSAETAEDLALRLCDVARYIERTLAAVDAETREAYAALLLDDALVAEIRGQAAEVRATAADLNDTEDMRVCQRQLDLQDGRVLHVIGMIHGAFRGAARRDATMLAPDLGALSPIFERPSGGSPSSPPAPQPVPPSPAPTP